MDKLRSGEFTRKAGSFLLAVGLHALILLIQGSGYWGASGDELGFTLIQPRLIEIEPVRKEARTDSQKAPSTPKPPAPPAKTPPAQEQPAPSSGEKPLTTIEEVHQEKPASRETRTEPAEVATEPEIAERSEETGVESSMVTNDGSTETEGDAQAEGETETDAPTEPALPPLGAAGGMAGAVPGFTYPKDAQHLGLEGRVLMEIYLTPEGTFLKDPVMLASSGHGALDDHCRELFTSREREREWKFKPAAEPYKLQVEVSYINYEVKIDFLGEAAYLTTEEGGELIEQEN